MSDGLSFDFAQIDKLAVDIAEVTALSAINVEKAVTVTARNVKDAWRDKLKGSQTLPALPYAVNYDVNVTPGATSSIDAEIGFDKDKNQGPLGNISEFGTPKTAPRGFGLASLHENEADFEKGINLASESAEKAKGL